MRRRITKGQRLSRQVIERLFYARTDTRGLAEQRIPFFVVGALARDLLLEHAWHLPPQRATRNIDFGVRVADWSQFE